MPTRLLTTGVQSTLAAPFPVVGWTCYVFQVTTGMIVAEIPMNSEPQYSRVLNGPGSVQITVPIGGTGSSGTQLRSFVGGFKFGLALSWGTAPTGFIIQAGPIMTHQFDDTTSTLTIATGGLWSYLNNLLQVNSAWTGSLPITDVTADTAYSGSYHDIVIAVLANAKALQSLPLTLPSNDGLGGQTAGYYGYDLATVGQRLTQLVQLDLAPEIDFYPAFSDASHIGWTALIGTPLVPSTNAVFDYGNGLTSIKTDSSAANLCNYTWVKGNGTERGLIYGEAVLTSSLSQGWPRLDFVDTSNTSETISGNLSNLALADLALYYAPVEVWTATVRTDLYPVFGSYTPGSLISLNVQNHPWIPNGQYLQRLISISQGQNAAEVQLTMQATQGTVI